MQLISLIFISSICGFFVVLDLSNILFLCRVEGKEGTPIESEILEIKKMYLEDTVTFQ